MYFVKLPLDVIEIFVLFSILPCGRLYGSVVACIGCSLGNAGQPTHEQCPSDHDSGRELVD